jgi:lipase chaperone LimK
MIRGTRVDGELPVTSDGRLILVSGIKRRFEYFLAAVSEEGMSTSVARIRENIERSLPPVAAAEAGRILDRYIQYKQDLKTVYDEPVSLPQSSSQVDALKAMVEKRKALRRKILGGDASDAFFGDDEIYDAFNLNRMALFYDSSLSTEEKQASLKKLEEQLPMEIRDRKKREKDVLQEIETSKSLK